MFPAHRLPPARRLIGAALLALLLTQWLALVHAVVHLPQGGGAPVAVAHEHTAVFGHSAGDAACELLDQLLIGQSATAPPSDPVPSAGDSQPLLPVLRIAQSRPPGLPPARGPPQA